MSRTFENWMQNRRRSSFDQQSRSLRRSAFKRSLELSGKSTPNPATESGWSALFGTDIIIPDRDTLFKSFSTAERTKIYSMLSLVFSCIKKLYTSAIEPPLTLMKKGTDGDELVEEHPILDVLDRPNMHMSFGDIVTHLILNLFLTGAGYWWEIRNQAGMLTGIWPIPTAWVNEMWSSGELIGFQIKQPSKGPVNVGPNELMWIKFPDPLNPVGFIAPLEPALHDVETDQERESYIIEMLKNAKVPGFVLKQKDPWTELQMRRANAKLEDKIGRGARGGALFVSGENADIELVAPLKDLDWPGLASLSETRICSVFGVPPILVGLRSGLDRATYSNAEQAETHFVQNTMVSLWIMLQESYTRNLLQNEGITDHWFHYDLSVVRQLQENEDELSDRALKQFHGGLITRNEGREMIGRDAFNKDVGDVTLQPINLIEVGLDGQMKQRLKPLQLDTGDDADEVIGDDEDAKSFNRITAGKADGGIGDNGS